MADGKKKWEQLSQKLRSNKEIWKIDNIETITITERAPKQKPQKLQKPQPPKEIKNLSKKKIITKRYKHHFVYLPNWDPFEDGADPCGLYCDGCDICGCFFMGNELGILLPGYLQRYRNMKEYCAKCYEQKLAKKATYEKYTTEDKTVDLTIKLNCSKIPNQSQCMGEECQITTQNEKLYPIYEYHERIVCKDCGFKQTHQTQIYEKHSKYLKLFECECCKVTYRCFYNNEIVNCKEIPNWKTDGNSFYSVVSR